MIDRDTQHTSGFSLVETLVAITILLIVIVGPLTLVTNSARSTSFANDQVIAYFLAQEGAEFVQAMFNDLQLQSFQTGYSWIPAWDRFTNRSSATGLFDECMTGGCGIHLGTDWYGNYELIDCRTDVNNCRIYYDDTQHVRARYTHEPDANEQTKYTRVITVEEDAAVSQVRVTSRVTWRSDGQRNEQEVKAVTYLFDVYGR